jgi:hypothetical protein
MSDAVLCLKLILRFSMSGENIITKDIAHPFIDLKEEGR